MPLAGVPILGHAVRGVLACAEVAAVVVVAPAAHVTAAREVLAQTLTPSTPSRGHGPGIRMPRRWPVDGVSGAVGWVEVVAGGAERSDSVAAGLAALPADLDLVLVHDAARCLTPVEVFDRVIGAVRAGHPAVVPGLAVVDTIKTVDAAGLVTATPARSGLRAIQTPQGFDRTVLERAHHDAALEAVGGIGGVGGVATDDAGLVERLGVPVLVVAGHARSLKVTTPDDLEAAARILGA